MPGHKGHALPLVLKALWHWICVSLWEERIAQCPLRVLEIKRVPGREKAHCLRDATGEVGTGCVPFPPDFYAVLSSTVTLCDHVSFYPFSFLSYMDPQDL